MQSFFNADRAITDNASIKTSNYFKAPSLGSIHGEVSLPMSVHAEKKKVATNRYSNTAETTQFTSNRFK